jgi:hypothetical protein
VNKHSIRAPGCVRKGDFVAVEERTRIIYALGFGRPSEAVTRWRVARVESATRAGIVKTVAFYAGDQAHKIEWARLLVHTLCDHQAEAAGLFVGASFDTQWESREALADAILSHGAA